MSHLAKACRIKSRCGDEVVQVDTGEEASGNPRHPEYQCSLFEFSDHPTTSSHWRGHWEWAPAGIAFGEGGLDTILFSKQLAKNTNSRMYGPLDPFLAVG